MLRISEMAYIPYNANKDNKNKGDCTIRSLSLAYNKSYEEVSKELRGQTYGTGRTFKTKQNIEKFIKSHGYEGSSIWNKSDRVTVGEFSEENPTGIYLLLTGRGDTGDIGSPYSDKDQNNYSHIVCCINGDVYDSWNSMKDYVRYFCIVDTENTGSVNLGDTRNTKEANQDYAIYLLEQQLHDQLLVNDMKDYTIMNDIGIVDHKTYMDVKWLKDRCPEETCFCVVCPDDYTVLIFYLIRTLAAQEMPSTFRPKIEKKAHSDKIVIKFSPRATNDEIDQTIENGIKSGIKKIVNALKKEQKLYNEVTTVSLGDKYPNFEITDCRAGSKCTYTQIYDLLSKCDKWIQENVLSLEYNMSGAKEYRLKLIPKFEDQNNNTGGMILSERGIVYFVGKNAKQLNFCYSVYCEDLELFDSANKYYNYERLKD